MMQERVLNMNISCLAIDSSPTDFGNRLPKQRLDQLYGSVEQLKRESNIIGTGYVPVIATLTNYKQVSVKDIAVTVEIYIKARRGEDWQLQPVIATLRHRELHANTHSEMVLFDMAGLDAAVIKVSSIEYNEDGKKIDDSGYSQNTPFLILISEMQNGFGGFKDADELETYFLLKNYGDHNIYLRGILLNMMYSDLEAINNGSYQISGKKVNYTGQQLNMVRALLQVDIISRIMMYIEDYVILLLANLTAEGNYYKLLDRHAKDDPDLGQRIQKFMERLDSTTDPFTFQDYNKMLNYIEPNLIDLTDNERSELEKRIEQNVATVKSLLLQLRSFGRDHSQIFRRYKHAGFAVTFDVVSPSPYKDEFDSHAMVLDGASPLHDVKSLPYSAKVLKGYSAMISTLQQFIGDAVHNRISTIERSSPGIVPFEAYAQHGSSIQMDEETMSDIVNKFWQKYPLRARNLHHTVKDVNAEKISINWYKNLNSFLENCAKNSILPSDD